MTAKRTPTTPRTTTKSTTAVTTTKMIRRRRARIDTAKPWAFSSTGSFFMMMSIMMSWCRTTGAVDDLQRNCYGTLAELRIAMEADFLAQMTESASPRRQDGFVYKLCPFTRFRVEDSARDAIIPVLNQTVIQCGDDGQSTNLCQVENGSGVEEPHVLLLPPMGDNAAPTTTFFSGITFANSKGWSVAAYDVYPSKAIFTDCVWKSSSGNFILHVRPQEIPDRFRVGEVGMTVQLEGCVIDNESKAIAPPPPDQDPRTTTAAPLFAPIFAEASTLLIHNLVMRNASVHYGIANRFGKTAIQDSLFLQMDAVDTIVELDGFLLMENNRFVNNRNLVGSVEVVDGGANVSLCHFQDNQGLAEVLAIDEGRDGERASLALVQNSCFEGGDYTLGPIFVAGYDTAFGVVNNYMAGDANEDFVVHERTKTPSCERETFAEPPHVVCLDPVNGLLLPHSNCRGTCISGGFEAPACPRHDTSQVQVVSFSTVPTLRAHLFGDDSEDFYSSAPKRAHSMDSPLPDDKEECDGALGAIFCIALPIVLVLIVSTFGVGLVVLVRRKCREARDDAEYPHAVASDFSSRQARQTSELS